MLPKKGFCQEWDLNPCPLSRTRILMLTPYLGARIEPWVWRLRPLGHPDSFNFKVKTNGKFVLPPCNGPQKTNISSHLGIEPRTFGLEVQRAILCANGTWLKLWWYHLLGSVYILLNNPKRLKVLAERSFDLRTSGLWAQHASTAPLCSRGSKRNLSEGRFELPPTEVDCDLNAAP